MAFHLYNILMQLLQGLERFHALFNKKSAVRMKGVQTTWANLYNFRSEIILKDKKLIWFHCASLGEFYQAKPLIELLSNKNKYYILLSFYSPSGFEQLKDYKDVDRVVYLPNDTRKNAELFVKTIQPDLVVFAKYEFWFNYLDQLHKSNYPFIYISSLFRTNHYLFKFPFTNFSIGLLSKANTIFVQDKRSLSILKQKGINNGIISGDTRVDAVLTHRDRIVQMKDIESFCKRNEVLIIGSSWSKDDVVYQSYLKEHPELKVIIAPHEVSKRRIEQLSQLFRNNSVVYSKWNKKETQKQILIIDSIGMLNSLYQYANMVYIGGGFGVSIHNTLEPAVFGIPIIFGPKYKKFEEARCFVEHKLAYVVQDSNSFRSAMNWAKERVTREDVQVGMNDYFDNNRNCSLNIYNELTRNQLI